MLCYSSLYIKAGTSLVLSDHLYTPAWHLEDQSTQQDLLLEPQGQGGYSVLGGFDLGGLFCLNRQPLCHVLLISPRHRKYKA